MKAGTFDAYPSHSADPFTVRRSKPTNQGPVFYPPPGPKSTPVKSIITVNVNRYKHNIILTESFNYQEEYESKCMYVLNVCESSQNTTINKGRNLLRNVATLSVSQWQTWRILCSCTLIFDWQIEEILNRLAHQPHIVVGVRTLKRYFVPKTEPRHTWKTFAIARIHHLLIHHNQHL